MYINTGDAGKRTVCSTYVDVCMYVCRTLTRIAVSINAISYSWSSNRWRTASSPSHSHGTSGVSATSRRTSWPVCFFEVYVYSYSYERARIALEISLKITIQDYSEVPQA